MTAARLKLGAVGEAQAARWYRKRGYRVVDQNWRCRNGEIDLIMAKGHLVVFCEVKTRSSAAFGTGLEAITPAKARRVRQLGAMWLSSHPSRGRRDIRFDVVGITDSKIRVAQGCL